MTAWQRAQPLRPLNTDELYVRSRLFEALPYCTVSQMDSIAPNTGLYFRLS